MPTLSSSATSPSSSSSSSSSNSSTVKVGYNEIQRGVGIYFVKMELRFIPVF